MADTFEPGKMYHMPTHFGPSLGPRQGPAGRKFTSPESHRTTSWAVQYLSEPAQLNALLPPGIALAGGTRVASTTGVPRGLLTDHFARPPWFPKPRWSLVSPATSSSVTRDMWIR